MTVRRARLEDRDRLVELCAHFVAGSRYSQFLKVKPTALQELVDRVLRLPGAVAFVAEHDGLIVGMIGAFALEEPVSHETIVDELAWWVEPAYRNGTVGPKLLRALENWGRQKAIRFCKMIAPAESSVGAYYERTGYQPLETSYIKRLT